MPGANSTARAARAKTVATTAKTRYINQKGGGMPNELHVIFGGGQVGQPLARILSTQRRSQPLFDDGGAGAGMLKTTSRPRKICYPRRPDGE